MADSIMAELIKKERISDTLGYVINK